MDNVHRTLNWGTSLTESADFISDEELRKRSEFLKLVYGDLDKESGEDTEVIQKEKVACKRAATTEAVTQVRRVCPSAGTRLANHQRIYVPCRDLKMAINRIYLSEQQACFTPEEKHFFLNCTNLNDIKYVMLRSKIVLEQRSFVQFVMHQANEYPLPYHSMSSDLRLLVDQMYDTQLDNVKAMGLSKYSLVEQLPLSHPSKMPVHLVPSRELLSQGTVAAFDSSCLYQSRVSLQSQSARKQTHFLNQQKQPVSKDEHALHLGKLTCADIIASAEVLEILVDSHPNHAQNCAPDRDILIEVKEIQGEDNTSHTVVYLDSVLPPRDFGLLDKKTLYCQHAAQGVFCKRDVKVFDFAARKEVMVTKEATPKQISFEDELRLYGEKQRLRAQDEASQVDTAACQNKVYGLWRLKYQEAERLAAKDKRGTAELSLLVRANYDSYQWVGEQATLSCVSVKLEHQPQYGAQTCNISELARNWLALVLRPNAVLNRVRVNAEDLEVIQIQKLSLQQILLEAGKCNLNVTHCLGALHHILQRLHMLEPDSYLLRLHPKIGQAELLRKTDDQMLGQKILDLQSWYSEQPTSSVAQVPYCPIDPELVTPRHKFHRLLPATFPFYQPRFGPSRNKRIRNKKDNEQKNSPDVSMVDLTDS